MPQLGGGGFSTTPNPTWGQVRVIKTGNYYGPDGPVPGAASPGLGVLTMVPFWSPGTFTADRMGVGVTTGVATAVGRLGIYGVNANDEPSTLLLDAGTVDASVTANVEATISFTFNYGLYYLACVSQVASATFRTVGGGGLTPIAQSSLAVALGANGRSCYFVSAINGALANVGALSNGSGGTKVMVRAA